METSGKLVPMSLLTPIRQITSTGNLTINDQIVIVVGNGTDIQLTLPSPTPVDGFGIVVIRRDPPGAGGYLLTISALGNLINDGAEDYLITTAGTSTKFITYQGQWVTCLGDTGSFRLLLAGHQVSTVGSASPQSFFAINQYYGTTFIPRNSLFLGSVLKFRTVTRFAGTAPIKFNLLFGGIQLLVHQFLTLPTSNCNFVIEGTILVQSSTTISAEMSSLLSSSSGSTLSQVSNSISALTINADNSIDLEYVSNNTSNFTYGPSTVSYCP